MISRGASSPMTESSHGAQSDDLGPARPTVARAVGTAAREAGRHGGHVDPLADVGFVAQSCANQPAHQLASRSTCERPALILLDRPGGLADQENALPGVAAEDRMRPGDIPGIGATRAGTLLSLQGLERLVRRLGCAIVRLL